MSYNDNSNTRSGGYGDDSNDNYGSGRGGNKSYGSSGGSGGYGDDTTDNYGSGKGGNKSYGSSGGSGGYGDDTTDTYGSGRGNTDSYGSGGGYDNDSLPKRTGGGLGADDDSYGSSRATGGSGTGRDGNQGLGSGRSYDQDDSSYGRSNLDDNDTSNTRAKRTGGGLGADDDAYTSSRATGGAGSARDGNQGLGSGRSYDQDDSSYGRSNLDDNDTSNTRAKRTGGGLGADDDAYDSSRATGGSGTGRDGDYGVGSGRTQGQEQGGYGSSGNYGDDNSDSKGDSFTGKLMQKAGRALGSDKLEEKGSQRRTGGDSYGDDNNY